MTDTSGRGSLRQSIIQDVEQVIAEELADFPVALTDKVQKSIKDEVVNHTSRILEALSFREMQSEGAQASKPEGIGGCSQRPFLQHLLIASARYASCSSTLESSLSTPALLLEWQILDPADTEAGEVQPDVFPGR